MESGRTEVRPYMGQSGRSEECPLRLAPPIYPDRAGTGRGKFRGRYRGDGRKMATSRFYRDKFRWPLQEDAAVLTMVPDRVRTGLPWAAEQRTGLPAAGRQECLCYFKERSFVVALLRMTILVGWSCAEPAADGLPGVGMVADDAQRCGDGNRQNQAHGSPDPSPEEQ